MQPRTLYKLKLTANVRAKTGEVQTARRLARQRRHHSLFLRQHWPVFTSSAQQPVKSRGGYTIAIDAVRTDFFDAINTEYS